MSDESGVLDPASAITRKLNPEAREEFEKMGLNVVGDPDRSDPWVEIEAIAILPKQS